MPPVSMKDWLDLKPDTRRKIARLSNLSPDPTEKDLTAITTERMQAITKTKHREASTLLWLVANYADRTDPYLIPTFTSETPTAPHSTPYDEKFCCGSRGQYHLRNCPAC